MGSLRLIHTSDWHLGKKLGTHSRLKEQIQVLKRLVEMVKTHQAHAVLVAGDVFDSPNPPAEAEALFEEITAELTEEGQRPVICIAGNHDSPERIDARRTWGSRQGILMIGTLEGTIPSRLGRAELLDLGNGLVEIHHPDWSIPLRLLLSPYFSPYRMPSADQSFVDWLQQSWKKALESAPVSSADTPTVMLTHAYVGLDSYVPELEEDPEEKSLKIGGAQIIPLGAFPKGLSYVALGHIHRAKVFEGDFLIGYSGSPLQYSFDDLEREKGVLLIELQAENEIKVFHQKIALFDDSSMKPLLFQKRVTSYKEAQEAVIYYQDHFLKLIWGGPKALSPEEISWLKDRHERLFIEEGIFTREALLHDSQAPQESRFFSLEEAFRAYYIQTNKGKEPSDLLMEVFREVLRKAQSA
ncbi:MAG: exonuclease subunit SbcD [Bacteroidia bacterium]|nr:exonuclease subunit SbcD [Bacteroidia bacterium]MDW8016011.1 exonuclease subunit SbcD [Bacteroidia bacterium]